MTVKLLTEHHFEFLSLKGGVAGSSESTLLSKCHIVGNHMWRLIYIGPYRVCKHRLMQYCVNGNPENRFSRGAAYILVCVV